MKKFYARTNKSRHEGQIAAKEHREGLLFGIKEKDEVAKKAAAEQHKAQETNLGRQAPDQPKKRGRPRKDRFGLLPNKEEHLPQTSYHSHHHISNSQRSGFEITTWLAQHSDDPGLKVSISAPLHIYRGELTTFLGLYPTAQRSPASAFDWSRF